MESQAVFPAKTQAKIFSIELGPWLEGLEDACWMYFPISSWHSMSSLRRSLYSLR